MSNNKSITPQIEQVVRKVDVAKLKRLQELCRELTTLDELLGHNAETARDQLQQKFDAASAGLPPAVRSGLVELLSRLDVESVIISLRMLEFSFPDQILFFLHLDNVLKPNTLTPELLDDVVPYFKAFLKHNPNIHLVVMSHDSADVTSVVTTALVGTGPIESGQVTLIYESGLGVYIGGSAKEKRDFIKGVRAEVMHVLQRMSIAAATRMGDDSFTKQFYYTASEYSVGIRVHPFARGRDDSLDSKAANELLDDLATALADIVKEDVKAVRSHASSYFVNRDETLKRVFHIGNDERIWDMEKVDELLQSLRFVHLGMRGSVVRPADATDISAAESLVAMINSPTFIVTCGDGPLTVPLLEWTTKQEFGMIACSEEAEGSVRSFVETGGGIEYRSDHPEELLKILDAYSHFKSILG